MHKILIIITFFVSSQTFGQTNNVWVRFTDKKLELSGYKDVKGNIKIPAMFGDFTRADTFYNIIAVHEMNKSYYLLKKGKKVGHDSVYVLDFTFACESEGKIQFQDRKTDKVGFFDKNGSVTIPAIYNYVTPFYNGVAVALKNATKKCWDNDCEYWKWQGGETVLINDKNEILISNWNLDNSLINWYSMTLNDSKADTSLSVTIKGENGNMYSFLSYKKEFGHWFYDTFVNYLKSGNSEKIKKLIFPEVTFWSGKMGWTSMPQSVFLKKYSSMLEDRFKNKHQDQISISLEDLNQFIFKGKQYSKFYNSCGDHNREMYPLFNIVITYYKPGDNSIDHQEHFEFIRTGSGYKLLSVSLKNVQGK